jgi:pseudaminic acid synthase
MKIGSREIGRHVRPFLIAELSGNHNQSLDRALALVDAAAQSGADAVKLQTYTPDTMTLDVEMPGFVIEDKSSLWYGRKLHDLYREGHTPWDWHKAIFNRAREKGLICFSSPFDETAVDFLEQLEAPAYKIASFELVDLPLIERVAQTGKPIIMSTGMATAAEIHDAVLAARSGKSQDVLLLKCTSTYPATADNTNVSTIPHMHESFGCPVGLSDHTMGTGVSVAATAMGAVLIEKHFTLRRADGGVDSAFSMEPAEFSMLRHETERAWQSIGAISYGPTKAEERSLQFRRSLYVSEDMKAGEILSPKNMRAIRPGLGLAPKHFKELLGMRVSRNVAKGTPLSWDLCA